MSALTRKVLIFSSILPLLSCSSERPPAGIIAQDWSRNTRQLGISPIYPPRESVRPGDVYIGMTFDPKKIDNIPPIFYSIEAKYYVHIDLSDATKREASKQKFGPTTANTNSQGAAIAPPTLIPLNPSGSTDRANYLVAFPGFTFASLSESDIGLNVTNSAWGALFGAARKSQYSVSFSVPEAELLSVPLYDAMIQFRSFASSMRTESQERTDLIRILGTMPKDDKYGAKPAVILINEVYLTRNIDIAITAEDAMSGKLSAVTLAMVAESEKKTKLQNELTQLKSRPTPTGPAAAADQKKMDDEVNSKTQEIVATQQEINTIAESVIPNLPGATGSVTRSSERGITLRQTFSQPVAIGYRGINYDINNIKEFVPSYSAPGPLFTIEAN